MTMTQSPSTTTEKRVTSPGPGGTGALVRNAFWHGKLMGVAEFEREQDYVRSLQRALSRLTVGCGVLCGLSVTANGHSGLVVGAGAAIDRDGQLLLVPHDRSIDDVAAWMCPGPDRYTEPGRYELCVAYHECRVAPTPALVTDCDTRIECKPSAIEERYRFEIRPAERHGCGPECSASVGTCLGHSRACGNECGQCVSLAWFDWDGQRVRSLSMTGRVEVPSNRELHEMVEGRHCRSDVIAGPRLLDVWPRPGSILDRRGSPSEWARWRYRPRLELTFDQAVNIDRIDDPNDWIRAWTVYQTDNGPVAQRLRLRYLDRTGFEARGEHTVVYVLDQTGLGERSDGADGLTIMIQAVADSDTGPINARPVARPAQLAYAGTRLGRDELDALWGSNTMPSGVRVADLGAQPLPECYGDGYDGGRLHAVFTIAPVAEEPVVTAVYPANGSRVSRPVLPAVEVSSPAPLPALEPKAWLVTDDIVTQLPLTGPDQLGEGERAAALERFEGSVDATLFHELAETIRYTIGDIDVQPTAGRVLVIAPARAFGDASTARQLGSFAGTCYSETEIARIYGDGLDRVTARRLRPSPQRMPRSSAAGMWIHWTFAWERDDDIIR